MILTFGGEIVGFDEVVVGVADGGVDADGGVSDESLETTFDGVDGDFGGDGDGGVVEGVGGVAGGDFSFGGEDNMEGGEDAVFDIGTGFGGGDGTVADFDGGCDNIAKVREGTSGGVVLVKFFDEFVKLGNQLI
ncbi:hypothetical protein AGMMS49936_09330 [Endomicrobiia bacterium]|nr:hypothetical protein AGMMS49936_09330 [Endomicrobiia bacterium]